MECKMRLKAHFLIFLVLVMGLCFFCSDNSEPSFKLPEPTGTFDVGTDWFYFTDSSRPETFTEDPNDFRGLAVRVWYPAKINRDVEPCPYVEHTEAVPNQGLPDKLRSRLDQLNKRLSAIKTHSYQKAPLAENANSFPVILYSHGYWAGMNQSTILMEELASHGYFTVSIGHSFETNSITKPDGTIIRFDPLNPEFRLRSVERQKTLDLERAITQTSDPEKIDFLIKEIMKARPKMLESLSIWTDDISFVIDSLEKINNKVFGGKLDLKHIGVIGHSFGGTASGQACLKDSRITAGINMDGLQIGDMLEKNINKPFIFMHHDNQHAINRAPNINFFRRAEGPAYLISIKNSGHYNFSDFSFPLISEVAPLPEGALGNIDGMRFIKILNDCVVTFFNIYLKNAKDKSMNELCLDYPEVEINSINLSELAN